MTDDSLQQPPEWSKIIRVRAQMNLSGLAYGETADVDRTNPAIQELLQNGYLIRVGKEE